jgi:hypothetical protein
VLIAFVLLIYAYSAMSEEVREQVAVWVDELITFRNLSLRRKVEVVLGFFLLIIVLYLMAILGVIATFKPSLVWLGGLTVLGVVFVGMFEIEGLLCIEKKLDRGEQLKGGEQRGKALSMSEISGAMGLSELL